MNEITFADFQKVEMCAGEIVEVTDFPQARKPAWILTINFGDSLGHRRSSVQATNYSREELMGLQVICVVNLPAKSIGGFASEVLVLGVPGIDGNLSLLRPTRTPKLGGKVY